MPTNLIIMKKLKTKVAVSYNNGLTATQTSKLTMELGSVAYMDNFTRIGVNFTYKNEEEEVVRSDAFYLNSAEEINGLFAIIQPKLPTFENEVQITEAKFLEGAKYQMAQTFGILVDDVEVIEEVEEVNNIEINSTSIGNIEESEIIEE